MGVRGDLRLQAQAIAQRWVNVEDLQQTMLSNLNGDLISENPRIRDAARKILVAIVGQNQKDEQHRATIELGKIRDKLSVVLNQSAIGNIGEQSVDSDATGINDTRQGRYPQT